MPQVEQAKSKRHRLTVVAGYGLIVFVVLAGVGSYFAWRLTVNGTKVANNALALDTKQEYIAASNLLQPAYQRALLKSDKVPILSAKAATESDEGNTTAALADWQKLDKLQPGDYATIDSIAVTAEGLGQNRVALAAYNELLPVAQNLPDSPSKAATVQTIQDTIARLEGGQ